MTSERTDMKMFEVDLDTHWDSGELLRGKLSVDEASSNFKLENYDRKSTTYYKDLLVTVGSGRFGCSLRLYDKYGKKRYLNFGSDIDQLLNRDKIVANVEEQIAAMNAQRDTDNAWQRIKNNIEVRFCDNLIEFQHQFTVEFHDCHLYGQDCKPVPMRVRGGGSVHVNSWSCSWRITPKFRHLFFNEDLTNELAHVVQCPCTQLPMCLWCSKKLEKFEEAKTKLGSMMDIDDFLISDLHWNPDNVPPIGLVPMGDCDLPAFGSYRAIQLWLDGV